MQGIHLRKYGVAATVPFVLYEVDGVDFRTDWTPAAGDVFMMRDEAAEEQVTNAAGNADLSTLVTDEGRGYSITLALEDMQAARVVIYLVDQATKAFLDWPIIVETYGHPSAQHAFDLDDAVRGGMTALPNAAADGAGGLPISDAGGLDLDAKLANTNEVTAARMGALTDWINGGRLDLILDIIAADTTTDIPASLSTIAGYLDTEIAAIKAVTDNLPDSGALTTIATNAARLTAIRAAVLTDLIDGGRLDLLIDAIKAKTDNLPADPADDSDIDAQLATIAGYLDTEIATILAAVDTEVAAIKAVTDLINGLLEDSGGYRYTAKALEEAPSGAGLTSDQNTALILIRDIMEGDAVIDTSVTPWQLVIKKKGTATEIVKKNLKSVAGVNLTAIATVIGQQLEP